MRFIFFLILFYFGFRLISKLYKKEGDVSVDKMPKKNKSKSDKLGDYVDYEEID